MNVTPKAVARYALMPGIIPRARALGTTGFVHIAFFMAFIYQACGLLPRNHPYCQAANIGRFGIRHVIAQSANNLVWRKDHADQIFIFFTLMVGLVILFMQCALLIGSFFLNPAFAQAVMPQNFGEFFDTAAPVNDIAFVLMDRVFGVPGLFNSCVAQNVPCFDTVEHVARPVADGPFPFPFHIALHVLFQLYSVALMVIAVLIFSYFIVTTIAETAKDGTPFGKRFNHVWAPIRMVVALGLLVPASLGLNSGQYITLYAAKWGSGFATNGWLLFNDTLTQTYLGQERALIAMPNIPEVDRMAQFFLASSACVHAHHLLKNGAGAPNADITEWAWLVRDSFRNPPSVNWYDTDWEDALTFTNNNNLIIRFGEYEPNNDHKAKKWDKLGFVEPTCGEMIFPVSSVQEPGSRHIIEMYYALAQAMWMQLDDDARIIARNTLLNESNEPLIMSDKTQFLADFKSGFETTIEVAIDEQVNNGDFFDPSLQQLGWAGAAIWYNKLAEMNGALTTAALNIPYPNLWPSSMEHVRNERRQQDQDIPGVDPFNPDLANGQKVKWEPANDAKVFKASYNAYTIFEVENAGSVSDRQNAMTNNVIIDVINKIFGTSGLFNMRENADIHPLAQLSAAGKGLIEACIRNIGIAMAGSSILYMFGGKGAAGVAGGMFVTFGMVGITAGFALFYVIPFLPFIYFFFAVGGWVKGIFEAMVGVPLWALAHIRIDGEGLPGDAAANGYYLILEIFLRPILILFGFLGSIQIFAALVEVLNDTFDLVIQNFGGFDIENQADLTLTDIEYYRGPVDEFFFTIIYVIIVYMIGVSSFKLVDLVPNNILRWMGVSVSSFGDNSEDPTQGLMQTVAIGGGSAAGQLSSGLKQAGAAGGHGLDAMKKQIGLSK